MTIPSEALKERERVETRRAAPKRKVVGDGIVQTTNSPSGEAVKTVDGM